VRKREREGQRDIEKENNADKATCIAHTYNDTETRRKRKKQQQKEIQRKGNEVKDLRATLNQCLINSYGK
jgi:hypothetical protein